MKLLVLGIDGGDRKIINRMDMPCLQKLLNERVSIPIREDLWSRGWSEIASGLHGRDTGAFYEKPELDGTTNFTQGFRMEDYYRVPGCSPLWDRIAKKGNTTGFVNLPTTLPAPRLPGFFISGAGSGFSPASRVPRKACYPDELYDLLLGENFIWEQRYHVSGIQSIDYFIDRCIRTVIKRTNVFTTLSQRYRIDFGFLMQKEFTIITNLFMREIQPLLDTPMQETNAVQRRLMEFFRVFDDFVSVLIGKLQPKHIMVVSDHSTRPYLHSLNLNYFLKDAGLLKTKVEKNSAHTFLRKTKRKTSIFLAQRLKFDKLFKYPFFDTWEPFAEIDYYSSMAFSNRYIPGVYLNDERFNDLVSNRDKEILTKEIIDLFNSSTEANRFNMRAKPYRSYCREKSAQACLPDIWIDLPDTIFPEQKGLFVQSNPYWKSFNSLEFVPKDVMTGLKGRDALCSVEEDFVYDMSLNDEYDLTEAYKLILRHF